MSSNEIETNDVNRSPDLQTKDPRPAGVLDRETLVVIMRILLLVREESGLAKIIRSWSAIY